MVAMDRVTCTPAWEPAQSSPHSLAGTCVILAAAAAISLDRTGPGPARLAVRLGGPAAPPPPGLHQVSEIEIGGGVIPVRREVLSGGAHVLGGDVEATLAASIFSAAGQPAEAELAATDEGRHDAPRGQDPPAPEALARQGPLPAVAGDVILAKSEQLAAARRELAGATGRLAAIAREGKTLRQRMENLDDEQGEIAASMPSLQAAADEHARTLMEALAAAPAGG